MKVTATFESKFEVGNYVTIKPFKGQKPITVTVQSVRWSKSGREFRYVLVPNAMTVLPKGVQIPEKIVEAPERLLRLGVQPKPMDDATPVNGDCGAVVEIEQDGQMVQALQLANGSYLYL